MNWQKKRMERSLADMLRIEGRVALITGGAGHLGGTIALGLAELGANIVILDLKREDAEILADDIRARFGVQVSVFIADLEQELEVGDVLNNLNAIHQRLDILVNCAALVGSSDLVGWNAPFYNQSLNAWRRALEINLTAPFSLVQRCLPLLEQSQHASIINIASIYAVVGPFTPLYEGLDLNNPAGYSVSKGGLVQLTRWLATTLAPKNIRVNCLSLGGIERNQPETFRQRYSAQTPLRRMGREEDDKRTVAFLA